MFTDLDVYRAQNKPAEIAKKLNQFAKVDVVAGKTAAGTSALTDTPQAVIAVLAFVTASGAAATKCLLAATTDYTFSGTTLTCVTDQSANTLVVIYR
jgi:hypothetical protein